MNFPLSIQTQSLSLPSRALQRALLVAMVLASGCSGCERKKSDTPEDTSTAGDPVMSMCAADQYQDGSACRPVSECEPGEYVFSPASEQQDRKCKACPLGTYSTMSNTDDCTSLRTCAINEFVAEEGSPTADQVCMPCPEGTVSRATNSPSCGDPDSCLPGEEQQENDAGELACRTCDPGEYCPGGEEEGSACADGYWDHDQSAATPCELWTACPADAMLSASGSATQDQVCESCQGDSCEVCTEGTHRNATCGVNLRGVVTQQCVEGAWVDQKECVDPDECQDGVSLEPAPCGPNGRETQERVCEAGQIELAGVCTTADGEPGDSCVSDAERTVTTETCNGAPGDQPQICVKSSETDRYEWQDAGECTPHDCEAGAVREQPRACGLNSLGLQPQTCQVRAGDMTGRWVDDGACLTDTICVANSERESPEPCGINGAGKQLQRCNLNAGAGDAEEPYGWLNEGECVDPHNCKIGEMPDLLGCGFNGAGTQPAICPQGIALVNGDCVDPDECVAGAERVLTTTMCTDGSPGDQHQQCTRIEGAYRWTDTECVERTCSAGDTQELEGGCGKNSRGTQQRLCDTEADGWVNASGEMVTLEGADAMGCVDPDICVDGTSRPGDLVAPATACGYNGNGKLGQVCVGGKWEDDANACDDPDVCRIGDVFLSSMACTIDNYDGEAYLAIRCADGSKMGELTDDCLGTERCYPGDERFSADTCALGEGAGSGRVLERCDNFAWIPTEECSAQLN